MKMLQEQEQCLLKRRQLNGSQFPTEFHIPCLWRNILTVIFVAVFIKGVCSNICSENTTHDEIQAAIFKKSLPRAGKHAGKYTTDHSAHHLSMCLLSCCTDDKCNSLIFHNRTCFLLACDIENPEGCTPSPNTESKYSDTVMMVVRTVDQTRPLYDDNWDGFEYRNRAMCNKNMDCGDHEVCEVTWDLSTRCECDELFVRDHKSGSCIDSRLSTVNGKLPSPSPDDSLKPKSVGISSNKHTSKTTEMTDLSNNKVDPLLTSKKSVEKFTTDKTCEFGIETCSENEECVVRENSKRKQGLCTCIKGYTRDENSDKCKKANNSSTVSPKILNEILQPNQKKDGLSKSTTVHIQSTTTTPVQVTQLTISAGENKVITLPNNKVSLVAFVVQDPDKDEKFQYQWTLITFPEGAETGTMEGKNTATLKLTNLIAGLYTLKIHVTGNKKFGEAFVNVTVVPPARKNMPPVAIIKPTNQIVKLPKSAIIDGSDSTDDDKIVKFHWDEVIGPIQGQQITGDESMLNMKKLVPGNYTFKLTVTDSDGSTNSTTANVTVIQEIDYPPKANAGSDRVVNLPENSVILYGNASTDDKKIVSYEWIKSSGDKLAAGMTGVRTPFLHLSTLEEGDYSFTLKVTDSAGQSSSADVHVFVKPEVNKPPVAVTSKTLTVFLPQENLVLDGHKSTDDNKVDKYQWTQTGGPTNLVVHNDDRALATATGQLKPGQYQFKLVVKDSQDLQSSATLDIIVKQNENKPPIANAGGDRKLFLPLNMLTIDGSKSSDDRGIKSYAWARETKSLASGDIVNGSDHQAVLQLVNLVAGRYMFTLTVVDTDGASDSDTASLIVKEDPEEINVVQMTLDANINHFTEGNKQNLQNQLALMLTTSSDAGNTIVNFDHIFEDLSGSIKILFKVFSSVKDSHKIRNGTEVVKLLKQKLKSESDALEFSVLSIETSVCQNNCSGHGHCNQRTKECICEAFWMQNFIKANTGDREKNCDWSILYVVIVIFVSVVCLAGITWGIICCCNKKRCCRWRWKPKKRHRYSLLKEVDNGFDELDLKPKGKIQNSSVMISETDISSDDEETLFITNKKPNGHIKPINGLSKHHVKKLKA